MSQDQASCIIGGMTFTGTFSVTGEGPATAVQVRYKDQDLQATTGGLPVQDVAQTLLKNLIEWDKDGIRRRDYRTFG